MASINGDYVAIAVVADSSSAQPPLSGDLVASSASGSPVGARTGGLMSSVFIGTGASYQINVLLLTSAGAGLTGGSVALKIRRASDNKYLDFADWTFKAIGWTTIAITMTEVDPANDPGTYTYTLDTSLFTNPGAGDTYVYRADASGAAVPDRGEIRVSTMVDRVDVATSTRATPEDVSTAETAINAHTDTATAPLATAILPGDDLHTLHADILSLPSQLAGAHGAGSWATADGFATSTEIDGAVVQINSHTDTAIGTVPSAVWDLDLSSYGTYAQVTKAGGALYALKILGLNKMVETPGTPGMITIYCDGGVAVYATVQLRDALGGGVISGASEPAQRTEAA